MGCDIHTRAEKRVDGQWVPVRGGFADGPNPFDWRSYGVFGFLADVRNYSDVPPLAKPRGLPADFVEDEYLGDHSFSWLGVDELARFDYDRAVEDRRVTRELAPNFTIGACTAEPGGGEMTTYRAFLGASFFADLERLKAMGAERVVFGFDS